MLKSDFTTIEIEGSASLIASELEHLLHAVRVAYTKNYGKEVADRMMNRIWENSKFDMAERNENIKKNIIRDPEAFRNFVVLMGNGGK